MPSKTASQIVRESIVRIQFEAGQIVRESIVRIQKDISFIPMMANVLSPLMPEDQAQMNELEHDLKKELHAEVEFAHELKLDVSILV